MDTLDFNPILQGMFNFSPFSVRNLIPIILNMYIHVCTYTHTYIITNISNLKAPGKMSELNCQKRMNKHCGERENSA